MQQQLATLTLTLLASFSIAEAFFLSQLSPTHRNPCLLRMLSADESGLEDDGDNVGSAENVAEVASNVLGTKLECCCSDVGGTGIGTGFYRNGYCSTGEQDFGRHTVCCQVTDDFLTYSASVGNDLSMRLPQYYFPGLKQGDIWCLCAQRWAQAYNAGMAPKIFLQATHEKTLNFVPFEILREYAIDKEEADRRLESLNAQRDKLNKLL